jgi:hypothetical protein
MKAESKKRKAIYEGELECGCKSSKDYKLIAIFVYTEKSAQ